jgi:hypothetical protein
MSDYYNRQAEPITQDEWLAGFGDKEQKVVDNTNVGETTVSTVWLGLDHSFGGARPLIFETMVFGPGHPMDQEQWRYSTEAEARAGHERVVGEVKAAA